jgi:hypothetical protein
MRKILKPSFFIFQKALTGLYLQDVSKPLQEDESQLVFHCHLQVGGDV